MNYSSSDDMVTKMMFADVAKTTPLSREVEEELFKLYNASTRDKQLLIKNKIINSNLRFVLQIAIYYNKKTGADLNELMTEGKIGLFNAMDKFKSNQGIKFISFAVWDIRCRISKYLDENDLVRIPAHLKMKLNKVRKEIAKGKTEIDFELERLLELTTTPVSFDTPIGNNEEDTVLGDVIKDENVKHLETVHLKQVIEDELRDSITYSLSDEERNVIHSMFGFLNSVNTIKDTEQLIGKSRERVRQIRDHALNKLKKNKNIKKLHEMMRNVNAE